MDEIIEPGSEWLHGKVRVLGPVVWYLSILNGKEHLVKLTRHEHDSVNGLVKVFQGYAHYSEQAVELFHFLYKHSGKRWQQAVGHLELFLLTLGLVEALWDHACKLIGTLEHHLFRR